MELKKKGFVFFTESDTEVIIRAYESWGLEFVDHFNGAWAFALFDSNQNRLILSRDRLGEKPLYYSIYNKTLVFASEIKSILAYGVPKDIYWELSEVYLTLSYIPNPNTWFRNIMQIPPGNNLVFKNNSIKVYKYWDIPLYNEKEMFRNENQVLKTFEDLLSDSVRIRMRSDVKFGAFLSGGLDSSSIVSIMSKFSNFPISTFTVEFDETNYNEGELAQKVATKFKTDHNKIKVLVEDLSLLDRLYYYFDQPFGDSGAINLYYISKFASTKVKMILTGDGGDEILSGYNAYKGLKYVEQYQKIPHFINSSTLNIVLMLLNFNKNRDVPRLRRLYHLLLETQLNFQDRLIRKTSGVDTSLIKQIINSKEIISIEDFLSSFFHSCPFKDDFYKLMYFHLKQVLPDDYLVKVDRMSMANSIEARIPFLDYRLVNYMTCVDKSIKLKGFKTKYILKQTIGKKLPIELINKPKKGFVVPLSDWFQRPDILEAYKNDIFKDNRIKSDIVNKVLKDNSYSRNYGNFLWSLLMMSKI